MRSKAQHYFTQALKIGLAAALIYWLWSSGKMDFHALKYFLAPQWALLGLTLVGINIFLCSERWRFLLKTQNCSVSPLTAFRLCLVGTFFNFAMPGGVGGDVVKAYYFQKDKAGPRVVALTSVLIDRALGLYAMTLMGLIVMLYDLSHVMLVPELKSLFYVVVALSLVLSLGLALVFSEKIHRSGQLQRLLSVLPMAARFQKIHDSFYAYGKSLPNIAAVILISWFAQVFSVFYLVLAGYLAGETAPLSTYFLVAPLGFIALGLPLTPAGVGVGQAAFYFLFNIYLGRVTTIGPTTITAFQVGQLMWGLVGAAIYLRRRQPMPKDFGLDDSDPTNTEYAPSR